LDWSAKPAVGTIAPIYSNRPNFAAGIGSNNRSITVSPPFFLSQQILWPDGRSILITGDGLTHTRHNGAITDQIEQQVQPPDWLVRHFYDGRGYDRKRPQLATQQLGGRNACNM